MLIDAISRIVNSPASLAHSEGPYELVDSRTGQLLGGGYENDSGTPVTAEGANNFHAWYRAMSLLAQKSAAVIRQVLKSDGDVGGSEVAGDHPVHKLVNRRANVEQTAFHFWLQITGHVASRGNGYAYLWREKKGGPVTEIIVCDPDRTQPIRKGGNLWYTMFPFGLDSGHEGYKFRAEDVLHFKGWGFDGLVGYPVWQVAATEIGLGKAERKLTATRMKNSGRPSMVLQTAMKLTDKAKSRIRDDWERMHTGLDNAGKTAILDGGLTAQTITLDAEELQQSAAAQMSLVAIANFTGVPVTKLGGGKPFATQEQEDRSFINDGLEFYLNLEDDEATNKLLTPEEIGEGYKVSSKRESLLRPDFKTKYEILRIATAGKPIMTQNEARNEIDLPPMEEPSADELGTPLNMGEGGFANEPTSPDGEDPGRPKDDENAPKANRGTAARVDTLAAFRDAARYAISHATHRMIKRLGTQAEKAAEKGTDHFAAWLGKAYAANHGVFASEYATAEKLALALSGETATIGNVALTYMVKGYQEAAKDATKATVAARVREAIQAQLRTLPQTMIGLYLKGK